MQCWPKQGVEPPIVLDHPPVVISSGEVPVRAGQIVRIHGWARVPRTIEAALDGLMIYDSGGGQDLAVRVTKAEDWQEFDMFRVAPPAGRLTVTFALCGFGEAWIDGVTVTPLLNSNAGGLEAGTDDLR